MSGTGVELGMEGLLAYCRRKSAMLGYDPKAPLAGDCRTTNSTGCNNLHRRHWTANAHYE